ncbi:SDR family oxidoreductase [Geomonas nitrogeniifigens]|uniref:SDR family oxidoreductase n=1 Tax=Geomonas diazotrophica TaxID=2843197 RepID=UPI001C2BEBAE|nr:SDR family oxidoreductase [Geomonas nitrogeniifigens]QXE86852.1 SDR family oxidoreductase [Geomonas nitrogeniifigens]
MNGTSGRVVVITGASAGLGRATARAFAREGAHIGLFARNRERLEAAREEVERLEGKALVLVGDVADARRVEEAADEVEREFGPIDVWVNNAMTSVFSSFKEMTAEEFRRVTEVTYLGAVHGTMAALKRMLPRNRGMVIQVGSALSDRSIPLQSAYCGAKHGMRGFTDAIRCELIHEKSRVHLTMVQLPAMNTPQFDWVESRLPNRPQPVPPIYQPEVAADTIVWASHRRRREIYVGLPTLKAMWGNKVARGLLDLYLGLTGYKSQQTDEPERPDRAANLWESVPGPYGAHGRFDARSKGFSTQVWLSERKWGLGALVAGTIAAAAVFSAARRKG